MSYWSQLFNPCKHRKVDIELMIMPLLLMMIVRRRKRSSSSRMMVSWICDTSLKKTRKA